MASRRTPPTSRVGNYIADIDTVGMDPEMKDTMGMGKPRSDKEYTRQQKERVNKDRARRGKKPL